MLFYCQEITAIDASIDPSVFLYNDQHYVEVAVYISGRSVSYVPDADSAYFSASVNALLKIEDHNTVIHATRFTLSSPKIEKGKPFPDLITMERIGIPEGAFTVTISLTDNNNADNQTEYRNYIKAGLKKNAVTISDIQLIRSFERSTLDHPLVKNGIYLEPLPYSFYNRQAKELIFYLEVYNTDQFLADQYALRFYIEHEGRKHLDKDERVVLIGHRRQEPQAIGASLLRMDISHVPSGNYNLIVEVRNRNNELVTSAEKFFQRSNPYLQLDLAEYAGVDARGTFADLLSEAEVNYSLEALLPRVGSINVPVVQTLLRDGKMEHKRNYILSYWVQYDAQTPYKPFREYMAKVDAVNREFSSAFYRGFQSDRGIIYLRYGPPNDIHREMSDPAAPPYEIWTYTEFSEFQNSAKFIFYNPSLAVNEYILLHSTARGEHSDPDWQRKLYRHTPVGGNYIDDVEIPRNFGSQGGALFGDF